jgi:hypothetical protein
MSSNTDAAMAEYLARGGKITRGPLSEGKGKPVQIRPNPLSITAPRYGYTGDIGETKQIRTFNQESGCRVPGRRPNNSKKRRSKPGRGG